jgi:hypothetical protein
MSARVKIIDRSTKQVPVVKRDASEMFVFRVNKPHLAHVLRVRRELGIALGSELKDAK